MSRLRYKILTCFHSVFSTGKNSLPQDISGQRFKPISLATFKTKTKSLVDWVRKKITVKRTRLVEVVLTAATACLKKRKVMRMKHLPAKR